MQPTRTGPISGAGTPPRSDAHSASVPRAFDGLRLIALFKFGKALLVILTTYGVHRLLDSDLLERIRGWSASLTDNAARRLLLYALSWVESLGAKRVQIVVAVAMVYAALVLAEGVGLWLRRGWGEWLTVCATASLIPFEIYEFITRPSGKLAVFVTLIVNIAVVWYLVRLLRHQRAATAAVRTEM